MDLKSKVKDNFFNVSGGLQIQTTKMVAISFALIVIGILIFEFIIYDGWYEFFNIFSLAYAVVMAIFVTSMLYLVCLAIEEDMFSSKNVENLTRRTFILAVAVAVISLIILIFTSTSIYSFISLIAMAFAVFLFGQILAICIENGVPINERVVEKADDIVLFSFLVIFTATLIYNEVSGGIEMYHIVFNDFLVALIAGVIFTFPVMLMVYSLALYSQRDNVDIKFIPTRINFDDKFSMVVLDNGAGLANFAVSGPAEEAFGQIKQWGRSDVLVKHFSFKNEDIKNQIQNSLMNPQGVEKIPNHKYIVHKDLSKNLFKVFNFTGGVALNLEGSDLKSLIDMMDSVEFMGSDDDVVKSDIVPLKEKSSLLASNPVCDVCSASLDVDKSYFVSNKIFYSSQKYKDWTKKHYSLTDADLNKSLSEMEKNDTTEGSAVCEKCIGLFK